MEIISHEDPSTIINYKRKAVKKEENEYISYIKRLISSESNHSNNEATVNDEKYRFSSCYNSTIKMNLIQYISNYTDDITIDENYLEETMENYKYCGLKNPLENKLKETEEYSFIEEIQTNVAENFVDLVMTCNQIMKAFFIHD